MPMFSYFYENELNETTQFIGSCDTSHRDTFEARIDKLCEAMGWTRKAVKVVHHYMNSVIDSFPHL